MLKPVYFLSLTLIEDDILLISEKETSSSLILDNVSIYFLIIDSLISTYLYKLEMQYKFT